MLYTIETVIIATEPAGFLAAADRAPLPFVQWHKAFVPEAAELPPSWRSTVGAYGCLRSHLEVWQRALAAAVPGVLVLEEDVVFVPDFLQRFPQTMRLR